MNELTPFGEFVIALHKHIKGRYEISKKDLVTQITGQDDASQASRYLRQYRGDLCTLYFYHKSTIAKIIASAYKGRDSDAPLVNRKAVRGYEFVGEKDSEVTVDTLGAAIDAARGTTLDDALRASPITPDSEFCESMCRLYQESYSFEGGKASDLDAYIRSVDTRLDATSITREIYKRVLLAVLLGPEAMPAIIVRTDTARGIDSWQRRHVDGFSLTQIAAREGALVPVDTLCYEKGRDVSVGRPENPGAAYSPRYGDEAAAYVSYDHAVIAWAPEESGAPAWTIVNHSEKNGTCVLHAAGGKWFSRKRDDSERLLSGDEIWLAPASSDGEAIPVHGKTVMLRFDHMYTRPHSAGDATGHGVPQDQGRGQRQPAAGSTPILEGHAHRRQAPREAVGFELGDLVGDLGHVAYLYDDLCDEDGYFCLSLGRQGEYKVGRHIGSSVSRDHADIEPNEGGGVLLTNKSSNTVIVRHVGGTFEELAKWDSTTLRDDDEVILAGGADMFGPFADPNGSVISFRYLYRS